jgi:predicted NUDIX family NTP pyrophosphohydrolase
MSKLSAGILLFKMTGDTIVVLIAHPGGPFWAKKNLGAWSVPKGEYADGDDPHEAALREFLEELGSPAPEGRSIDLGEIKQSSGKRIRVWSVEGDLDPSSIVSNAFEIEWPPRSGESAEFPEVDRASWETVANARLKLVKGQVEFLDRLMEALGSTGETNR